MINVRSLFFVVPFALAACTPRPEMEPGGTGLYAEPPAGVVAALPEGAFHEAVHRAEMCEAGDFGSCALVAYYFETGAPPTAEYGIWQLDEHSIEIYGHGGGHGGGHGEDHGDEHGDDEHAEDGHGDDHHGDEEHADEGHDEEHADADHAEEHDFGPFHGMKLRIDEHHAEPVPVNLEMAAALYRTTCENGWQTSCARLAHMHLTGHGVARDADLAEEMLKTACGRQVVQACYDLATAYFDGDISGGVGAAIPYLTAACDGHYTPACDELDDRI